MPQNAYRGLQSRQCSNAAWGKGYGRLFFHQQLSETTQHPESIKPRSLQ